MAPASASSALLIPSLGVPGAGKGWDEGKQRHLTSAACLQPRPSPEWEGDHYPRLLNDWQRNFPLTPRPFAQIAEQLAATEAEVIRACADLLRRGVVSRLGGVWAPGVGGAALLCAMKIPSDRLEQVAALVSAHPGVNHNYEREHALNLWFVITGNSAVGIHAALTDIERRTGLPILRMRMVRPYRIDLGFTLHRPASAGTPLPERPPRVQELHAPLAALVEAGLPLVPAPFDHWAEELEISREAVLTQLEQWLQAGTLRRFGLVVRHHEVGYTANAMTVFDIADDQIDGFGERLASQPGVTLCYRRERAEGWPYNLYCMVHGRTRQETLGLLRSAMADSGLSASPHQVLFSCRRFKQQGARYFRAQSDREMAHDSD